MENKRTTVDFSRHILTTNVSENAKIYIFKDPLTSCFAITFINSCGILAVTGDCGNWIFCREFHPSRDGFVSDSYWVEKLIIASAQKPTNFDGDATREEIKERLSEEDIDDEHKEYLASLLEHVDEGEFWYTVHAYENLPSSMDHESVPYIKKLNPMLKVVFDAFDEICRRMEKE